MALCGVREGMDNVVLDINRGGSGTAATSKMKCFVIIVDGFQPLIIITKHSNLEVEAALDPSLINSLNWSQRSFCTITKEVQWSFIYLFTESAER